MKLVIDIPDEMWERVKEGYVPLGISKHLRNGVFLPKRHGRLIDADALLSKAKFLYKGYEIALTNTIGDAPTIIEADKEV